MGSIVVGAGQASESIVAMRCPTCHRATTPLFTSRACDYCDGVVDFTAFDRGWVVYGGDPTERHYVFAERAQAQAWRAKKGRETHDILEVISEDGFTWRGTPDGLVADRVYYVYPDHRFEPASDRAFLRPAA